jgi:hypothetical protein
MAELVRAFPEMASHGGDEAEAAQIFMGLCRVAPHGGDEALPNS